MPATQTPPRFAPGQQITAARAGRSFTTGVVLEAHAAGTTEVYLVRWADGRETFFVPGPDARREDELLEPISRRSESAAVITR